jgi:enoyl-CoA hydratase/carnithine racemase
MTLNRPEALNAIDVEMRVELDLLLDQIRRNDSIRVVVITGEGRGFSAGGDLRSEAGPLAALDDTHDFGNFGAYRHLANYFFNDLRHVVIQRAIRKLEELQAVTIAAINGPAVGIGLELATACDIRYASDRARLGEVAVPAGFVPESGGARNLPKLVGFGRAMEMILTGEIVEAAEAQRIGLVERVFSHEMLLDETFKIADRIAAAPFLSTRQAKALVRRYWDHNKSEEGARAELEAVMEITRTGDCREGIAAFLEKRPPNYRGPGYQNTEGGR